MLLRYACRSTSFFATPLVSGARQRRRTLMQRVYDFGSSPRQPEKSADTLRYHAVHTSTRQPPFNCTPDRCPVPPASLELPPLELHGRVDIDGRRAPAGDVVHPFRRELLVHCRQRRSGRPGIQVTQQLDAIKQILGRIRRV